jgi:hypothetical protein
MNIRLSANKIVKIKKNAFYQGRHLDVTTSIKAMSSTLPSHWRTDMKGDEQKWEETATFTRGHKNARGGVSNLVKGARTHNTHTPHLITPHAHETKGWEEADVTETWRSICTWRQSPRRKINSVVGASGEREEGVRRCNPLEPQSP